MLLTGLLLRLHLQQALLLGGDGGCLLLGRRSLLLPDARRELLHALHLLLHLHLLLLVHLEDAHLLRQSKPLQLHT